MNPNAMIEFAEALFTEQHLPDVLAALAHELGARGATLVMGDTSLDTVINTTSIDQIVAEYFDGWYRHDPREARVHPSMDVGFTTDFHDFSAEQIEHDPFYQDFLIPRGYGWHANAGLAADPAPLVLSLKRPTPLGPYTPELVDQINAQLPALRAGASLANRLWRAALGGHLGALQHLGRGAVILDAQQRVTASNDAVPLGAGLLIRHGQLRAQLAGEVTNLQQIIDRAFAERHAPLSAPCCMLLHRPGHARPLVIECASMRRFQVSLAASNAVIVVITDLESRNAPNPATLQQAFRMTPRETELAVELARGQNMEQAAQRVGISTAHARQRAKTIYAKAGCTTQAELAALLARL